MMTGTINANGQIWLPADEYAIKHNMSRRTLTRRVAAGRVVSKLLDGRQYILDDSEPEPIFSDVPPTVQETPPSAGQALTTQHEQIVFQLGIATASARLADKRLAAVLILAFVSVVLAVACAGGGVYIYHLHRLAVVASVAASDASDRLAAADDTLAGNAAQIKALNVLVDGLRADLVAAHAEAAAAEIMAVKSQASADAANLALDNVRADLADARSRVSELSKPAEPAAGVR